MTTITSDGAPSAAVDRVADGLGWFSLALGAPQLFAPRLVNDMIGVRDDARSRTAQRIVGVREFAAAAGILGSRRRRPWLWGRVAGDAMDLVLLGEAWATKRVSSARLLAATASVAGVTVLDVLSATSVDDDRRAQRGAVKTVAVTLDIDVDEAAAAWRRIVTDIDAARAATFRPAPSGTGTEVYVRVEQNSPLVDAVKTAAGMAPHQQIKDVLRRFKQLVEAGEIARSDAMPEGETHERFFPRQRPAQPVENVPA
jgi:hypothetical protein